MQIRILLFQQNGLLEHLSRKYIPDIGQCSLTNGHISKTPVVLNLKMLWPLFALLVAGLTLCTVTFIFSLYWNNRDARSNP